MAVELVCQIPLATLSSLLVTRENAFAPKYNIPSTAGVFPLIPPEARITREKFQTEFVLYCEVVLEWLTMARRIIPDENSFIKCHSLLLFLEKQREVYTAIEVAAVSDADIGNCVRIFGECGVSERMFLLLLGGENPSSLPPKHAMDLVSSLTQRAALFHPKFLGTPLVKFSDPFKLIDRFLALSILPEHEIPRFDNMPPLCSKNLFWAAWSSIILWIAGGEIAPHFEKIYETYPILRYLVLCIMTKRFDFPLEFEGKSADAMREDENTVIATETLIVEQYEKKMMRPPNSLPANVYMFPNRKDFRAPHHIDDVRIFADQFQLASRFARCSSPPLLSRVVANVGAENSLFAVREMLTADATTASMLTAECVFHALLYYFDNQRMRDADQSTNGVIRALVRQAEINFKTVEPIENDFLLHSFISSLASPHISVRSAAVNTFAKLFPSSEDKAFDLVKLAKVPRFEAGKLKYLETLANAILVESDTRLSNSYLQFLTENSAEKDDVHALARAICHSLPTDCYPLHASLCQYFLHYVNICTKQHQIQDVKKSLDDDALCCVEFGTHRVTLSREVPVAIIKLLSKYTTDSEDIGRDVAFEALVQLWLSPGAIPKLVDRTSGAARQFLSLPMRKEMIKSAEQRVVDAALDELSEKDAQEFVLVSQMSIETAEKVIRKAENMPLNGIDRQSLANMYLLIRGYRMRGIEAGGNLTTRLKQAIDAADNHQVSKEETDEGMEITEVEEIQKPISFLLQKTGSFQNLEVSKMPTSEISAWLKANCGVAANSKQKDATSPFRLPPSFITSAMNDEKSSLACLQHIEANLKYFLSHESAFQTLVVIIDAAANKFSFVQKRLENLAVRLLKSVSPPASVTGVLQKHAANSRVVVTPKSKSVHVKATTFSKFTTAIKGATGAEREKRIVDEFMMSFVRDKGEVIEWQDVFAFIRSLQSVYSGGNAETTAERCLSNRWTPDLQRTVCSSLSEKYRENVCSVFVFRLLAAYCRKFPMASYSELFTTRQDSNKFVLNNNAFASLSVYFADVVRFLNIVAL
uniref:Integrator complex subunit 1 INTS2-binding domain-containing protein n=1 Tax=Caenorhabditis japonica TaxID=281687 RepID=A0A8R1DS12_CAEJA